MISIFNNMTIKRKLIFLISSILITSTFILVGYFIWIDFKFYRDSLIDSTETVTVVVGDNAISSLIWGYSSDGERVLKTLKRNKSVKYAELFKKNEVFATFKANKSFNLKKYIPPEGATVFKGKFLYVHKPIVLNNKKYGSILVVASTEIIWKSVVNYAIRALIFAGLLIVIVIIFTNKLQKIISEPITKLSKAVAIVSKNHDYSVNLSKEFQDEVGLLYDGFNNMMAQVNQRNKEIQKSRAFLMNVLDSMPVAVIGVNKSDVVTHFNNTAEIITNIKRKNVNGVIINKIYPDFQKYVNLHNQVLEIEDNFIFTRESFSFAPGRLFKVVLYPLKESDGMIILIDDITLLEKKEMQLRQVQKMETVGTLSGGLAHDFNNVLGGITGALSLLNFRMENDLGINELDLKKQLGVIQKSADRASAVVKQLLSISRSNMVSFTEINLINVIKDTINIVKTTFERTIEINLNFKNKDVHIIADGDQLSQVLLNIFVNACHAMTIMKGDSKNWGGMLNISLEYLNVGNYFKKMYPKANHDNYWVITIADNGIGMNKNIIKNIFDPFFTTKDKGEGSGLGLAMCYNIIEQHEGFFDVYSELDVGTTFKIFLPLLEGKELDNSIKSESKFYKGSGVVLLVDDDEQIRDVGNGILKECGYDVLIAEDGEKALELFSANLNQIDVVLLDLVMPKLDGKNTFIRLKEMKCDVKVILSSGYQQDARVTESISLGVNAFVQKPYTLKKLSEVVHSVLNEAKS